MVSQIIDSISSKVEIIRRATYHLKVESTTRRQGEPDPESEDIIIGLLFTNFAAR